MKIRPILLIFLTVLFFISCSSPEDNKESDSGTKEKTVFQTSIPWMPVVDVRADVAIVYGTHDSENMTFEERVQTWRDRGYTTHFMTGIAWGGYQDYFTGKWDGETHLDKGQVSLREDTI